MQCKLNMVCHHKCAVMLLEWQNIQMKYTFALSKHTTPLGRGHQAGITTNSLIAHLEKIAAPP